MPTASSSRTLRDIVRKASAEYAPLAIKQERASLGPDIRLALEESWGKYGVTLNQVNLGDIQLEARRSSTSPAEREQPPEVSDITLAPPGEQTNHIQL